MKIVFDAVIDRNGFMIQQHMESTRLNYIGHVTTMQVECCLALMWTSRHL